MALTDDVIFSCDLDGNVLEVNNAFERVLGWEKEDLLGHTLTELAHRDDRTSVEVALNEVRTEGSARLRIRLPKKPDGVVWYEIQAHLHEGTLFGIGRRRTGGPTADLESVVSRIMRREQEVSATHNAQASEELETEKDRARSADRRADIEQKRAKTYATWIGALVTVLSVSGGAVAWAYDAVKESSLRAYKSEQRKTAVDQSLSDTNKKLDDTIQESNNQFGATHKKIDDVVVELKARDERMASGIIATQVQVADSTTYISDQLVRIDPDVRRAKKPKSVQLAEDKAKEVQDKAARDKLLGRTDPLDPLEFLKDDGREPGAPGPDAVTIAEQP